MLHALTLQKNKSICNWRGLFVLTVMSAYFYAFMEWLFFATKPSSLSILSTFESLKVLFVTAGTIALISIALLFIFLLPASITSNSNWQSRLLAIGTMIPALILSITALIMLDNFTYTVFKFGIVSTEGAARGLYALGFLFFLWRMLVFAKRAVWVKQRFAFYLSLGLLAVSITGILMNRLSNDLDWNRLDTVFQNSAIQRPNVVILGSDGLSASYLSAYDSELETTPFLRELAQTSLVAENAFPNAASTTGSTTSVLTGKESIRTKVFRYPDILSGRDSFQHLPGILRQLGYKTVEIGTPSYVDARKLNLIEGFDIVNGQALNAPVSNGLRTLLGNSPSTYFIQIISERASERLLQIFFVREMPNPLEEVEEPDARISDEERVEQIIDLLEHDNQPVFIFAHLMDTHGPEFSFEEQVFSDDASANEDWDKLRYMDALLTFDGHVQRIYEHLAETGLLDHTILVIYTDHGFRYAVHERLPVIIHFPENRNTGRRKNNVQNIDIPPTLLDYLRIPVPKWMNGRSLLNGEPPAVREIISTTTGSAKEIAPPFHQINIVQVIVCQKWYALNVRKNAFDSGEIIGHTSPCNEELLPSEGQIHQKILKYLETYGYDVRSLR